MHKRTATVLAGIATAGLLGTGIAAAAVVTPGDSADGLIHMCYSESSKAVPNNYVQFREDNFGTCLPGYQPFSYNKEGQPGTNGADGTNGISGYEVLSAEQRYSSPGTHTKTFNCPAGKVLLGGGYELSAERGGDTIVKSSQPTGISSAGSTYSANAWEVRFKMPAGMTQANMKVLVTCGVIADTEEPAAAE